MEPTTLTAIIQGIVQIVTIVGTIWGLFKKQNKELDVKLNKQMDRLETKINMSQRPISKYEEPKA